MPAPQHSHSHLAATAVLRARNLTVERGGRTVLHEVSLSIGPGTRLGVVGVNGSGKSTLLQALAGHLTPTSGSVTIDPPLATIGYLSQEHDRRPSESVRELVARVTGVVAAETELVSASKDLTSSPASIGRYERAWHRYESLGVDSFEARLATALDEANLADVLESDVATLSGGQEAKVALACLELSRFDVALLDEPTNDLDFVGLERLEAWLHARSGAIAIVSHDREFLERTVDSVVELDEHSHHATSYGGGWRSYESERATARSLAGEAYDEFRSERDRLRVRAQRQRQWAVEGVAKARRKPRDHDVAQRDFRLNRTEKQASKARQTERALERLEVVEKPFEGWDLQFSIDETKRSGDVVVALDEVVVDRGTFRLGPVSLVVSWRDRVAITGLNGAGKSTLLNVILNRVGFEGRRRVGPTVVMGALDQDRRELKGEHDLVRYVGERCSLLQSETRSLLAKFGIGAADLARSPRDLSPGERTRVELAIFQARGVNLLILDEPTNHLDLAAIEQLESALAHYNGTLLLTTHDRRLLDTVTLTRTIDVNAGIISEKSS